ncbi:MAG: ribosome biogenesis GTP-binding protein YihA/YsxC [Alphaproteobacteria bacterium]|jgi:GTP-binding protein|nr:ribosome biogenesis GTP-binding protein YihA/YsxC [Alphaproteobacteria bacterium]MDP6567679.1 ribosome biogenesis GTP-binding protein YihA/YsxC [Alphaproteobacteria bacterium]MDP6814541.1 ribosome biogenesis GTP-binding protein YihA/YsxC [Alphaproteobacteria bacterium]
MPAGNPGDDDGDDAAIERGRLLFAQACDFVSGARLEAHLPAPELPEVAFAGRSNVGKSSLINALTGRKTLARTSNTPGRTREINFFRLGGRLMLVDLPGHGYARAAKTEIERWNQLIEDYLHGRAGLRRVCLLLDARRGITESDQAVMRLLDQAAVVYQAVVTKADKAKPAELAAALARIEDELRRRPAAHPEILVTSAVRRQGLEAVRASLAALAEAP